MAILRAIVQGERDLYKLADLKHSLIRASREEIAQSLQGNWRPELLFILEQSLSLYDTYHQKIKDWDSRIEAQLKTPGNQDRPCRASHATHVAQLNG